MLPEPNGELPRFNEAEAIKPRNPFAGVGTVGLVAELQ